MSYLQYFKAISIKISEHHEANPGFDSWVPAESPSCRCVFVRFGDGTYIGWSHHQSKMLSECDWAPENLNLFNKS